MQAAVSHSRESESSQQTLVGAVREPPPHSTHWIPAFAGMTAAWSARVSQMTAPRAIWGPCRVCYIRLLAPPVSQTVSRGGLAWIEHSLIGRYSWLVHASAPGSRACTSERRGVGRLAPLLGKEGVGGGCPKQLGGNRRARMAGSHSFQTELAAGSANILSP